MENRIKTLFKNKNRDILSIYFTAGYPKLDDTKVIINCLQQAGVDMIEIGIPFSDPLADGRTIQMSNRTALKNGMTVKILFDQLSEIRSSVTIPLLLMSYLNPVLRYGIEDFCKRCKVIGVDGVILPDLPVTEYQDLYQNMMHLNGLVNVLLITPETSKDRIRQIDKISNGFIYMVSSSSTTGNRLKIEDERGYFFRIKKMKLANPTLIGFGISDHKSFAAATAFANGAIIGSAFIKALENSRNLKSDITKFVSTLKNGSD